MRGTPVFDDPLRMASRQLLIGRWSQPGACYAVTIIANGRRRILHQTAASLVATEMRRCEQEGRLASWAWVVMPEHVHWLLSLRSASLSGVIQAFKSRSARAMNAASGGSGAIWQRGFYDHQLRDDEDLLAQARYILANPIRSGLVNRVEDYPHARSRWQLGTEDL